MTALHTPSRHNRQVGQWRRQHQGLWRETKQRTKPAILFCIQAVAAVLVTTFFFSSCSSARILVFGQPSASLIGRVDELETSRLKVGSVTSVNIDGSGQQAIALLLIPRLSWLDALGSQELKAGNFRPDLPELVIAEQHGTHIQERYRLRVGPEGDSRVSEAIRDLGLIPRLTISDIDGDGRDEVIVEWDVIGATGILSFATITEYADGRFRTVDPLPSTFEATIPTYAKYAVFWIRNDYADERIFIHAAQDYQIGQGRLIVSVQGEALCMACESAFQVLLIKPMSGRGTAFDPMIYSSLIVPKPQIETNLWEIWTQGWKAAVKMLAEMPLP